MEQGKPLIITGLAFSGIGLLLIIASFAFSSNPMLSAGCATIIVGLALVGIAAAMATSGSSIAHRGEEQIPVVYSVPAQMPQPIQPGEIRVTHEVPEQPGQHS